MAVLLDDPDPLGVILIIADPVGDVKGSAQVGRGLERACQWCAIIEPPSFAPSEEILDGKRPEMPPQRSPFAEAPLEREQAKTKRML
jgi:hypothetical protein